MAIALWGTLDDMFPSLATRSRLWNITKKRQKHMNSCFQHNHMPYKDPVTLDIFIQYEMILQMLQTMKMAACTCGFYKKKAVPKCQVLQMNRNTSCDRINICKKAAIKIPIIEKVRKVHTSTFATAHMYPASCTAQFDVNVCTLPCAPSYPCTEI